MLAEAPQPPKNDSSRHDFALTPCIPLRPLTALYASWYGSMGQKPNVSGPPYGFTACRHMMPLATRLVLFPYGTLRQFTFHGTDGGCKTPMFPAFLTDLRLADTWCYSPAGLPPVSTPSCRADLSRRNAV